MLLRFNQSDPTIRELKELDRQQAELERQQRAMAALVKEAPRHWAEKAATMPPPDDLRDRIRQGRFEELLASRRELRNEHRAQAGNTLILLLLVTATAAVILWMVHFARGI
jgi:hypothetical protein